jgi:hypothetical protein
MLKDYTENQIKSIINILILNNLLKEKTITSGFGSVIDTTPQIVNWYMSINKQIDQKNISYDAIHSTLIIENNKLELNIPADYIENLSTIKIKKISDELLEEFDIINK